MKKFSVTDINRFFKTSIVIAAVIWCNVFAFAIPYFSGQAGSALKLQLEPDQAPDFMFESYFSGQFDLSPSFIFRTTGSLVTSDSIFSNGLFRNINAIVSLDELSLTYRGFMGNVSHYMSFFVGDSDPAGSCTFLRRHYGLAEFQSKLAESPFGTDKSRIVDMSGIGGSYVVDFLKSLSLGMYVYYNKTGLTSFTTSTVISATDIVTTTVTKTKIVESLNSDLRFAGAWPQVAFDLVFGANMPIERTIENRSGHEEKVIMLIRRGDLHLGFTALFGSANASNMIVQAGFSKLIIDPNTLLSNQPLSLNDCYIFIEPRFVTKNLIFSLALYNIPEKTLENFLYLTYPVGMSLTLSSPWFLSGGKKLQFGVIGVVSFTKGMEFLINNPAAIVSALEVSVRPFGTVNFRQGKLNFSANLDCMKVDSWESFCKSFSMVIGYKYLF
ncbi:MAG: hypothetical protein ACTTHG_04970 [Treponemataceae bacterium]